MAKWCEELEILRDKAVQYSSAAKTQDGSLAARERQAKAHSELIAAAFKMAESQLNCLAQCD